MKLVYMGTPSFAVEPLRALVRAGHEVALVVTRPDAVRGRGKKLIPSDVKVAALEAGLKVCEATRMTPELIECLHAIHPDVQVVAAYGALLPQDVLDIAPTINVHASLLPQWRGAAPIQRGILAGDKELGVSIMQVVKALDAGAYTNQRTLERGFKRGSDLMAELSELGAEALVQTLAEMNSGTVTWTEQDEAKVTYATKISKDELLLDPALSAKKNFLRVQASLDAAPARAVLGGRGVRIMDARPVTVDELPEALLDWAQTAPSASLGHTKKRLFMTCAEGILEVLSVKPDGKQEMNAASFIAGLKGDASWSKVVA